MTHQATASTALDTTALNATALNATAQDSAAPNPQNPVYRLDADIQRAVRSSGVQASPALRQISRDINWWGGDGVIFYTLLVLIAGRVFKRREMAEFGLRGAEGIALSSAISAIIKGFAGRSRPFISPGAPWHWSFLHGWTDAHYFSMPSGHTTATFGFTTAVCFTVLARQPGLLRWSGTMLYFAAAFLVAFSRVYTDQHWFSDVAAGALLGLLSGIWLVRFHARNRNSRLDRIMLGAPAQHL